MGLQKIYKFKRITNALVRKIVHLLAITYPRIRTHAIELGAIQDHLPSPDKKENET